MNDTTGGRTNQHFSWARSGFDIEGWIGAGACLIVGFLLGLVWSALFFLGLVGAVTILAATRHSRPVPPQASEAVVSPVDGVVHAVSFSEPPPELGLGKAEAMCLRIASAPWSSNSVTSPVTGNVASVQHHPGRQGQVFAFDADDDGLEWAVVAVDSGGAAVGLKVMVGAFGPRLEIDVEAGDVVRLGRRIGKRRLGGWCDVWLPAGLTLNVLPGQTLVGGETILSFMRQDVASAARRPESPPESVALDEVGEILAGETGGKAAPSASVRPVSAAEPMAEIAAEPVPESGAAREAAAIAGGVEIVPEAPETPTEEASLDEETAALFARLRREVGAREDDETKD